MRSSFDPQHQNAHLAGKITAALERIAEAFRVLLWREGKAQGLSPIQIQLLIFVRMHPPEYCKVSYLAQEFNLSKPTISDAVGSLEQKQLIEKVPDAEDSRSYRIRLTESGRALVVQLAGFCEALQLPVEALPAEQQNALWGSLLSLILALQKTGVITAQRMCYSCAHYRKSGDGHYCALLQMPLAAEAIRLDCPEHAPDA